MTLGRVSAKIGISPDSFHRNFSHLQLEFNSFGLKPSVRIEIQDEGPGFSDADKTHLFGFFQRLSAKPTGGENSTGIGLAIVKKIVDLHEGRIAVVSHQHQGSTFVVDLPTA
jgi:signal transduction histidine kinase